ncbi:hypothetical protein [Streptomyces sp. NBC_01476]|uniref:hypothetical protein n=1 Tax=Streptomyces sp. NBC_01476 TaxID=2903881 RepID=UPI002E3812CB|nr:hypothetical protein [Streptomyces sp. NBC_01476]
MTARGGSPYPIVLDMSAARRELGYRAVTTYQESLPETVAGLVKALDGKDWTEVFPFPARLSRENGDWFDYAAEDAWLARRAT